MISPTYGSVFSCLIIGSILMFYLYLQSKDKNFIFRYGCNIVIISILAVIFRMFLLGSFTFTHSIYIKKFEVPLFDFLRTEIFHNIQLLNILLCVSLIGTTFRLSVLIYHQYRFYQMIRIYSPMKDTKETAILDTLKKENNIKGKISIIRTSFISSPCITGLFHPVILLPQKRFSADEMTYILRHELQHYQHHDLWIYLLCELMVCIYWWNPFCYLLRKHLKNTLEFVNDIAITKTLSPSEQIAYLTCILKAADSSDIQSFYPSTLCCLESNHAILKQRFQFVLDQPQHFKKSFLGIFNIIIIVSLIFISIFYVFEPDFPVPKEIEETTMGLEPDQTFFVKGKNTYIVYYKGIRRGTVDTLRSFPDYKVYTTLKEAKQHETLYP